MDRIKWGILGTGRIAQSFAEGLAILPNAELRATGSRSHATADSFAERWNIPKSYASYESLATDPEVDAVYIATPHSEHMANSIQCLEVGKAVLCEKPLGMNHEETVEVYQAARDSGQNHMVAFTYRFVPGMNYLRHLVQSGELGQIRHTRFQRLQDWGEGPIGWRQYRDRAGSGELGDMGIHRIDFAEDLLGPIQAVCGALKQVLPRDKNADGTSCPPQDVEDWVAWIAEFEGGTTGVFEMGKLTRGHGPAGDHDIAELNGSRASAAYRLHAPHEILYAARGEPSAVRAVPEEFLKRPGSPRDPLEGEPTQVFRYDQAWEFVCAIREGRECCPSFYHGMRAQTVADVIIDAAKDRRWIDVQVVAA